MGRALICVLPAVCELAQVVDPELVGAVLVETGAGEWRLRLLPARVVVYFVLALALFECSSCTAVWGRLGAGLRGIAFVVPAASSLSRARRRVGAAPLRGLVEVVSGPVATPVRRGGFYRGLRVVAVGGTTLCVPDEQAVAWCYPKRCGPVKGFGYPLLRLVALVECGTRALLGVAFGPDTTGELGYAHSLLAHLDESMVPPAGAYYDAHDLLRALGATRAAFLVRATRERRPAVRRALPDGSCLTTIARGKYRAGAGYGRIRVCVIEARMTVALADGARRTGLWRVMASLLDAERHRAEELIGLYRRRWRAETCYFSLKSTILDGRVLRSRTVPGIEQEVYALLTVYQALIRAACDLITARPEISAQRVCLTVLLNAAADHIVAARTRPRRSHGSDRPGRPSRPGRPAPGKSAMAAESPCP